MKLLSGHHVMTHAQAELNPHAVEEATEGRRVAVKQQRLQLADLHRQLAAAQGALQQQVAKREALLLKVRQCTVYVITLTA